MKSSDFITEKWSKKYKRSINCSHPKGFSQRAHCAGRKKNEAAEITMVCPDCGYSQETLAENDNSKRCMQCGMKNCKCPGDSCKCKPIAGWVPGKGFKKAIDEAANAAQQAAIAINMKKHHKKPKSMKENDDSDAELFGTKQTPPRNAQALYHWSRMDPNRYSFRAIAEFALSNGLTLKQALEVTSRFDEYNEQMQDEYGVDDDQMSDLFGAYEEVCDAWNTDPSGDTSTNDSWENLHEVDAELAEPPERPRKQDTKTKTKPDIKFDIPFQQAQDHPLAKTDPLDDLKKKAGLGGDKPEVNIRKASKQSTLDKTSGLGTPEMGDMLSRMRNIELDPDLEPYDQEPEEPETLPSVEVNTANLPAVAGQALQAAGVQNPEFHQVANLPGNMADMIRQLGKSLFGSLTMTPTKRIHVVANLGGQGPNTSAEVNAVAGFLKDHGDDRGPGDIDFDAVMPGYKAQTHMYTAAGIRWMLVKDFAGQYIYCWPEEDSHDAQDAISMDKDVKKLR